MSMGHFDIYDLNYEQIVHKLKNQGLIDKNWVSGEVIIASTCKSGQQASSFYEFKWGSESSDIFGPYNAKDMKLWQGQGYLDKGSVKAWIRQVRSAEFALQEEFKEYDSKMQF